MKNLYHKLSLVMVLTMLLALAALGGCADGSAGESAPAVTSPAPAESAGTEESAPPAETEDETGAHIRAAALNGPTGMGMSFLMDAAENGGTVNTYEFTLSSMPEDINGKFINGDVDVAAVPINVAAVLQAKTGNVKLLAVNTLGVLYVLENGETVQSVADLAGKTVQATGQGSTPEYVLSYILEQNGLTDSVTVEYLTEHSELAGLLASGGTALGMLPEPQVSVAMSKNPDLRVALDLTEEWEKVSGTQLIQGCIIARADFAAENTAALEIFLDEYAESVDNVNSDPAAAAALISEYGIVQSAAVAEKAIPNCNIVCITGDELVKAADAMFAVLFEANPQSVGGQLPDESIYF